MAVHVTSRFAARLGKHLAGFGESDHSIHGLLKFVGQDICLVIDTGIVFAYLLYLLYCLLTHVVQLSSCSSGLTLEWFAGN
jgi:hypothetical protein